MALFFGSWIPEERETIHRVLQVPDHVASCQIEARAFEMVQKAVKNRVAAIEMPVHQPMH